MPAQQSTKKDKPKVETVIHDCVKEEYQRAALDFVEFIRANKMVPVWASTNSWKVSYKGQCLCYIRTAGTAHYHELDDGSWHIHFAVYSDYVYDMPLSEDAVKIIWSKVRRCTRCSHCSPANHLTINGKEFDHVCHQWLTLRNPDTEALDSAKKLVEAIRRSISGKDMQ